MKLQRVPGSLRSEGKVVVAVDMATRAQLKVRAGGMPVSKWLRGVAFGQIKVEPLPPASGQGVLAGTEAIVSDNTLSSLGAEVKRLSALIEASKKRHDAFVFLAGMCVKHHDEKHLDELFAQVKQELDAQGAKARQEEHEQSELKLAPG